MNIISQVLGITLLWSAVTSYSMLLDKQSVYVPRTMGSLDLVHKNKRFYVIQDKDVHPIQNCWLDKEIRNLKSNEIAKRLKAGMYFSLHKNTNNEYSLKAHGRLRGGGPITGQFCYWGTKIAAYGAALGAAVYGVMTVAPAMAPAAQEVSKSALKEVSKGVMKSMPIPMDNPVLNAVADNLAEKAVDTVVNNPEMAKNITTFWGAVMASAASKIATINGYVESAAQFMKALGDAAPLP